MYVYIYIILWWSMMFMSPWAMNVSIYTLIGYSHCWWSITLTEETLGLQWALLNHSRCGRQDRLAPIACLSYVSFKPQKWLALIGYIHWLDIYIYMYIIVYIYCIYMCGDEHEPSFTIMYQLSGSICKTPGPSTRVLTQIKRIPLLTLSAKVCWRCAKTLRWELRQETWGDGGGADLQIRW